MEFKKRQIIFQKSLLFSWTPFLRGMAEQLGRFYLKLVKQKDRQNHNRPQSHLSWNLGESKMLRMERVKCDWEKLSRTVSEVKVRRRGGSSLSLVLRVSGLVADGVGECDSLREVRLRHWAEFGTSFFLHKNRPFDLENNIFSSVENELLSFGQTQPRWCNHTSHG